MVSKLSDPGVKKTPDPQHCVNRISLKAYVESKLDIDSKKTIKTVQIFLKKAFISSDCPFNLSRQAKQFQAPSWCVISANRRQWAQPRMFSSGT